MLQNTFKKWLFHNNISIYEGFYERAGGKVHFSLLSNQKPKNELVIYLHGTGNDSGYLVEPLFIHLLREGYKVFTFDLDGHGPKSTTILSLENFSTMATSAIDVAKTYCDENCLLHLIGISLGGLIALHGTSSYDHQISKILCLSSPFQMKLNPTVFISETSTIFDRSAWGYIDRWGISSILPAIGPFRRKRYPIRLASPKRKKGSFAYVTLVKQYLKIHQSNNFFLKPKERRNISFLFGENDYIAKHEDAAHYLRQHPHITIKVIPGVNHFAIPIIDHVNLTVLDLLKKGC